MAQRDPSSVQVAVVGGGPAGAATALALRNAGVSDVLLVEPALAHRQRVGETVPPEISLPLAALGLWQRFLDENHEPCLGSCSMWGSERPGYNDFVLSQHGHGWHLDRRRFDRWLLGAAAAAGAQHVVARLDRVERTGAGLLLHLAEGLPPVRARFVVDATGYAARVAIALGAARQPSDALLYIGTVFEEREAARMSRLTLLEAVEYGWWYAARLPGRQVAVAVATDRRCLHRYPLLRLGSWLRALAATKLLSIELAGLSPVGRLPRPCIAHSSRLDAFAGPDWLAVGDAAMSFDPIASRGIYQALQDGLSAAAAIGPGLTAAAGAALAHYRSALERRWLEYCAQRDTFYARERRWTSSMFWQNRAKPNVAS